MKAAWLVFPIVLAALLGATSACEKSDPKTSAPTDPVPEVTPPAPPPPAPPASAGDRAMKFMDTLATAIEAHVKDCDQMADAVDAVFAANADFVELIEKTRNAEPETRERLASSPDHADFEKTHGAARGPMLERIAAADACMAENPRLRAALGRLGKR